MSLPSQSRNPLEADATERNKAAWDELYGSTPRFVWGTKPVGFLVEFIAELPPLAPTDHVLDAATGEGRNLPLLQRLGGRLHACDSSANALLKIPAGLRAGIDVVACDLRALPFPDGFFRCVLLSDVIETLPDADSALAEVVRVLAPGGLLLCNMPGMEDGIAGIDMQPVGENHFLYHGRYYYHFLGEAEARLLLERHGLEVRRVRLCRWREEAHPEFRPDEHLHASRVFLAAKRV